MNYLTYSRIVLYGLILYTLSFRETDISEPLNISFWCSVKEKKPMVWAVHWREVILNNMRYPTAHVPLLVVTIGLQLLGTFSHRVKLWMTFQCFDQTPLHTKQDSKLSWPVKIRV